MWWLSAHKKKSPSPSHDLFGNNVSPKVNQVFTVCLNNFPIHVESPVCHAEDGFLTMHVTQRYQGHTMIKPWKTTWAIFFRSRCANRIYIPWGDFWILWGDFLVAVCHAVGWLVVLWGTKGRTLVLVYIHTLVYNVHIYIYIYIHITKVVCPGKFSDRLQFMFCQLVAAEWPSNDFHAFSGIDSRRLKPSMVVTW